MGEPTLLVTSAKHKSGSSSIENIFNHDLYNRGPNADPNLTSRNQILIDMTNGKDTKTYVRDLYAEFRSAGAVDQKMRSNAVGTIDTVIRANGIYLNEGEPPEGFDIDAWTEKSLAWADRIFNPPNHEAHFINREGKEETIKVQNIYLAVLHVDEKTPHIHILSTTINQEGHFVADTYMNRTDLRNRQDLYYDEVGKEFGLKRGVRYSKAEKRSMDQYYSYINEALATHAPDVIPGESAAEYKERVENEFQKYGCHMANQDRETEKVINEVKSKHRGYIKEDYRLHGEINKALGNGHGKDIDMELVKEAGHALSNKRLLERALEHCPDRELVGDVQEAENSILKLIMWEEEREREILERKIG